MKRNTPEAPDMDHCDTCGASPLDGNGTVTPVNGIMQCGSCAKGAADLIAEDPSMWSFGPDGRLRRAVPSPGSEMARLAVIDLNAALTAHVHGIADVTVETFHPQTGVAVILPNGYRWHVFIPGEGIILDPNHSSVMLFSPDRSIVKTIEPVSMADISMMRDVVLASLDPTVGIGEPIAEHAEHLNQIAGFNPDDLLTGN